MNVWIQVRPRLWHMYDTWWYQVHVCFCCTTIKSDNHNIKIKGHPSRELRDSTRRQIIFLVELAAVITFALIPPFALHERYTGDVVCSLNNCMIASCFVANVTPTSFHVIFIITRKERVFFLATKKSTHCTHFLQSSIALFQNSAIVIPHHVISGFVFLFRPGKVPKTNQFAPSTYHSRRCAIWDSSRPAGMPSTGR